MDIKLLKDFLSLARTRNFTSSARERGVTQPAFSRRIQLLEDWVGCPLVDRSSYPASLTPAGLEFRDAADTMLSSLFFVRDELRTRHRLDTRTITFSTTHTVSAWFFPKWLHSINHGLKKFEIRVKSEGMYNSVQALVDGDSDFLICFHYEHTPELIDPEKFSYKVLTKNSLVPVTALKADGTACWELPGTSEAPVEFLSFPKDVHLGSIIQHALGQCDLPCHLNLSYENSMAESLKTMTIEGHGISWLPLCSVVASLKARELARIEDTRWDIPVEIRLYRSAEDQRQKVNDLWAIV